MSQSTSLNVIGTGPRGNSCGGCTACCDVLGIEDLGKPFYARCKHLHDQGCAIYADRPSGCATFRCAWHAGVFGDSAERRPDRCGLMFDINPTDNPPVLHVWEVIPGALASDRLQYLIRKMRDHKLIRAIRFGNPAVILYPYGAKMGVRYPISSEYEGWKLPASPTLQIRPTGPAHPDQAQFAGEVEPLRMPRGQTARSAAASPGRPAPAQAEGGNP